MLQKGEYEEGDCSLKITRRKGPILLPTFGDVLFWLTAEARPLDFQFRTPGIFSLIRYTLVLAVM
jgi:hypothetical protein